MMKLSEAIRLGAMLAPQAFGGAVVYRRASFWRRTPVRHTCALMAALDAAGIHSHSAHRRR